MDTKNDPSPLHWRQRLIQCGDTVLLKLPSGEIKSAKLEEKGNIGLGKFGNFPSLELVGQVYGLTYEIVDKSLQIIESNAFEDVEDTNATNEFINDADEDQPTKFDDVEAMKESGAHVTEIIQYQISQHANFSKKTEYSKDKYRKRKEAKFSKSFSTIEPTIYNICDYWFHKDQSRVRDIRPDALSQMMALGNVQPGGRYLVADDASGILIAALLDRLGGEGRVMVLCDVESQPVYHTLDFMNFPPYFSDGVLATLNWATADPNYIPVLPEDETPEIFASDLKNERRQVRLNKRKVAADSMMNSREEMFRGGFDGLLLSSQYDAFSIVERLTDYLSGSASIVIHSPHIQPLSEVQAKLRADERFLSPSVTEPWLRRYQVLPGRTHPLMSASGSGGYILHTIRVLP